MPLSRQALKGWHNKMPSHARLPLPEKVVSMMILQLWSAGRRQVAIGIGLAMARYPRP